MTGDNFEFKAGWRCTQCGAEGVAYFEHEHRETAASLAFGAAVQAGDDHQAGGDCDPIGTAVTNPIYVKGPSK